LQGKDISTEDLLFSVAAKLWKKALPAPEANFTPRKLTTFFVALAGGYNRI
jgi:hypothetical protein